MSFHNRWLLRDSSSTYGGAVTAIELSKTILKNKKLERGIRQSEGKKKQKDLAALQTYRALFQEELCREPAKVVPLS